MVTETEFKILNLAFAPISDDESDKDIDLGDTELEEDESEDDEFSASPAAVDDDELGGEEQ